MSFKKVERSYFSSPSGWRLATYDEVKNGPNYDEVQSLLNKWDRVRLLDGWILGPGYDFQRGKDLQIGNDFRGCLGFMLLIRTQSGKSFISGSAYEDVHLSDFGREVALFLCVDDWNYEVVYWLLNSWSNSNIMDLADVRGGSLKFSDAAEFKKWNHIMGEVARSLGKKVGDALEKSGETKYYGLEAVKHVLSDMIKFVREGQDIVQLIGDGMWEFRGYDGDEYCLPLSVEHDDVDVAFWSFICDSFAGYVVEVSARTSLKKIRDMETVDTSKRDFNIASSILLYLSDYRSDIIHAPLAHKCSNSCAEKILQSMAKKAADEGEPFKQILQNNPMWRCYDDSRNYHLLNKLLIILAKGKYTDMQEEEQRVDSLVVDRLLECGAQHGPAYAIGKQKYETALHHAATLEDERYGMQVAERLLRKCELVDATDNRRRTALHRASKKGNADICRLLVDKGATVNLQDVDSKTALHSVATCFLEDKGLNVAKTLLEKCDDSQGGKFMNAADKKGRTALHRASKKGKSQMCQLFLDNSAAVDAQNNDGKTALHYAATSYYGTGMKVAECLLGKLNGNQRKELANTTDKKGRTALHRAVERGKASICQLLLRYGGRVDALDTSGKSPIDIAVADENIKLAAMLLSKSEEPESYFDKLSPEDLLRRSLLDGYETIVQKLFKNRTFLPDAEDGKTALHLAVMGDNENSAMELVWMVLCNSEETPKKLVAKPDKNGRTVLHEAALKGYLSICVDFLRMDPDIIYVKSRNGRNALYDAVEGKFKGVDMLQKLLKAYLKKDRHVDDLIDSRGWTPLHVAVSERKTELVIELLSKPKIKEKCLSKGDIFGRTSLHEAAKLGDSKTVAILLNHGAHPLNERDCDGRTALHYAVQSEKEENKEELAKSIVDGCKSDEEKLLLLWASAAGLGTADEYLNHAGPLYTFLERKKEEVKEKLGTSNLLKMAASLGNTEMAKELITRGYQIEDIREEWSSTLPPEIKEKVDRVSKQIENIREQGNDQPAISDNLGRSDYAQGLAALFLNPYLKPPIAVGISGSWGMGKSSLMVQTESLLLTTAAQMALLKSSKLSDSALNLPDIKPVDLSKKGKIKYKKIERQIIEEIDRHQNHGHNVKKTMFTGILRVFQAGDGHNRKKTLEDFLNKYDPKYHKVFKSLAAMDSSHMFTRRTGEDHETQRSLLKYIWDMVKFKTHATQQETNAQQSTGDGSVEGYVPAVLTVRYNAWKYRSDIEALAGMAVEITKEIEGTMTNAQWLNTCWRNTWKKKKYTIFIEIIFPCLLTIALALSVSLVLWLVLDRYKSKEWAKAKYASLPIALVTTAWTITKSVMGILKPVSTQLMNYISFPDHSDKLGYQERVISDITFLKDEIGKSPHWLFTVLAWFFTTLAVLWRQITESWVTSMLFNHSQHETSMEVPQVAPASGNNLRIIVFVDDLDRCNESVILQVLSAVSLVLAVCEINVVIGMDKRLIERAIIKKYGDVKGNKSSKASEDIADMYLQKIIQLPLDLPDPSEEQAELFLKGQLGVLEEKEIKDKHSIPADTREEEAIQQNTTAAEFTINMGPASSSRERRVNAQTENEAPSQRNVEKIINDCNARKTESSILIRELLFVRYSRGEQNAFCYFQKLSTVYRKLPREWKRFLNYHRLVWYIFSVSKEAMVLFGWQVQLITWIFICWEWKDNMNFIIENWRKIPMLKSIESNPPSLLMIVEYFMEEDEKNKNKEITTTTTPVEGNVAKNSGIKKPESSSNETEESLEAGDDKIGIKKQAGEDNAKITDDVDNKEHEKLETLEKTLAELKKEMKEFKERVSDEFMKVMKELTKEVSDELKKDITELKQQMVIKKVGKNEKTMEEKKRYLRIVHWEKMKLALERYDVPMDGIQAFQRFRFYCIAGYLPQHLSRGI